MPQLSAKIIKAGIAIPITAITLPKNICKTIEIPAVIRAK
jgi:hypothetical protein